MVGLFFLQANIHWFHAREDHPGIEDCRSEQSCIPPGRSGQTGQSSSVKKTDHEVNSPPLSLSLSSKRVSRVTQLLPSWRFWTLSKTVPSLTSILSCLRAWVFLCSPSVCAVRDHHCVEGWELGRPKCESVEDMQLCHHDGSRRWGGEGG